MKTNFGCKELGSWLLTGALLCSLQMAMASPAQSRRKAVKKAPPPDLPSGPTGPVQQIPLDSIAAVPPQVTYENNELTIVAPNSTLADVLRAVKKLTGAEIDVPAAPERVVTRLGPGPARDIVAELLNGSRFNYVLLGAPNNQAALSRVVLVAKTGSQEITPNTAPVPEPSQAAQQQPNFSQPQPEMPVDANGGFGDPSEDNNTTPEENAADQNGNEAEQPPQENPGVKTPQQMLQEMQQRQMQLQQQQPPGQPPIPGSGMPPHPPQEP
jgi:hypothetical protein